MHPATDLYVHLVQVPVPVPEALHPGHTLPADISSEHRAKPVPPVPHCLVTNVDPALEQQILDVAQRQGVPDIHHHHETDDLR